MRTLVALAVTLFISTTAAWAAVEGQIAGSWKAADGTILQIKTDGSYSKLSGSRVIETGTITALDGKWNLRSSSGKPDSGTFSIIGGSLTLRSSVVGTTSWSRATTLPANSQTPLTLGTTSTSSTKQTAIASAPPLQSGVSVNSQQSTYQGSASGGNQASYPAPVAVPNQVPTGREIKGGLKSFASAIQQAAVDGYNGNSVSGNTRNLYGGSSSRQNFNGTAFGARRLNFSQPQQQSQGAPDPFLMKGGSFRDPGDGHGTYSAMKKNWEQQQLSSLPAVKPIPRVSDETTLYGVSAFEKRALGPAVPFRIKFLGLE